MKSNFGFCKEIKNAVFFNRLMFMLEFFLIFFGKIRILLFSEKKGENWRDISYHTSRELL